MSLLDMVRAQDGQGPSSEGMEATEGRARQAALRSRLKEALVERLGLDVVARIATGRDVERSRAELAVTCRAILNSGGYEDVADDERAALVRQALDDVCGLGPLQGLLEDDAITEVVVNGTHGLFFERDGKLYTAPLVFDSDEQILTVVDKILAPLGRRLDQASPIVNARLANGDRVNAVAPPVAVDGPAITIRKFSNRITSLDELTALGSLPTWYARLLSWAVALRKGIVAGEHVAKVAGGDAEVHHVSHGDDATARELGIGVRIVDHLGHQATHVDGVGTGERHAAPCQAPGDLTIGKDALDLGLAVVKGAIDAAHGDVGAGLRGHLEMLDLGHLALGIEHRDARALHARKACERRLAGVAGGGGDDHDVPAALRACHGHQTGQHLECHVLEGAGGAMVELKEPIVSQGGERRDGGRVEVGGVGAPHAGGELLIRIVAQQHPKDLACRLMIGLAGERGHVELGLTHGIADEEAPIGCDAGEDSLLACYQSAVVARAVVERVHVCAPCCLEGRACP